jgi:mannose-6-phosphate isomerase-like protein (cupin superfamily)
MGQAGLNRFDPRTSSRIVFRKTGDETNGDLLQFDSYRQSSRLDSVLHVHPRQEEKIHVISGTITFAMNGITFPLAAGHTIVIPPGKAHAWQTITADNHHVVTELRPALHFEEILQTVTVASGPKTAREVRSRSRTSSETTDWLRIAATLSSFPDEYYAALVPIPLQRLLLRTLGPILRHLFHASRQRA